VEEFYSTRIVPEIATAWEQVLRGGASIQTHITAQLHVTSSTPERRSGERERGEIGGGGGGGGSVAERSAAVGVAVSRACVAPCPFVSRWVCGWVCGWVSKWIEPVDLGLEKVRVFVWWFVGSWVACGRSLSPSPSLSFSLALSVSFPDVHTHAGH